MNTVTVAEMKKLEAAANAAGLSYETMMENAGGAVATQILQQPCADAVVYCGPGNNGGDGYVIARLLADTGRRVLAVQVNGQPRNPLCRSRMELAQAAGVSVCALADLSEEQRLFCRAASTAVDAVYGTGFHGEMSADALEAAQQMTCCPAVWAVDIPSGVESDTGRIAAGAVEATTTVAFHAAKYAHNCTAAAPWCGKVSVADIGIDNALK